MNKKFFKKDILEMVESIYNKYQYVKEIDFNKHIDKESSDIYELIDEELRFIISKDKEIQISDIEVQIGEILQESNGFRCIPKTDINSNVDLFKIELVDKMEVTHPCLYLEAICEKNSHVLAVLNDEESLRVQESYYKFHINTFNYDTDTIYNKDNDRIFFGLEKDSLVFYNKNKGIVNNDTYTYKSYKKSLDKNKFKINFFFNPIKRSFVANSKIELNLKEIDFFKQGLIYPQIAINNSEVLINKILWGREEGYVYFKVNNFHFNKIIIISNKDNLVIQRQLQDNNWGNINEADRIGYDTSSFRIKLNRNIVIKKIYVINTNKQ